MSEWVSEWRLEVKRHESKRQKRLSDIPVLVREVAIYYYHKKKKETYYTDSNRIIESSDGLWVWLTAYPIIPPLINFKERFIYRIIMKLGQSNLIGNTLIRERTEKGLCDWLKNLLHFL